LLGAWVNDTSTGSSEKIHPRTTANATRNVWKIVVKTAEQKKNAGNGARISIIEMMTQKAKAEKRMIPRKVMNERKNPVTMRIAKKCLARKSQSDVQINDPLG
jgi:UDP-glucose 4-epimerase